MATRDMNGYKLLLTDVTRRAYYPSNNQERSLAMKLILMLTLVASLGGCVVLPLGYYGDGYRYEAYPAPYRYYGYPSPNYAYPYRYYGYPYPNYGYRDPYRYYGYRDRY